MRRRVESIYSKRSEEPKTACQRKPTAPLALSSTERRDLQPVRTCDLRAAPDPAIQDPQQGRNSYSTQLRYSFPLLRLDGYIVNHYGWYYARTNYHRRSRAYCHP